MGRKAYKGGKINLPKSPNTTLTAINREISSNKCCQKGGENRRSISINNCCTSLPTALGEKILNWRVKSHEIREKFIE